MQGAPISRPPVRWRWPPWPQLRRWLARPGSRLLALQLGLALLYLALWPGQAPDGPALVQLRRVVFPLASAVPVVLGWRIVRRVGVPSAARRAWVLLTLGLSALWLSNTALSLRVFAPAAASAAGPVLTWLD